MQKTKIIIVEDEFFAANHLRKLVISLNFEVVGVFHSGEELLERADWNFDCAIVDIFLSKELTGLDIAIELNKHSKPFIFLTANQDRETLQNAALLNPSAYLNKPFKSNDVAAALTILVQRLKSNSKMSYLRLLEKNEFTKEPLTAKELDIFKSLCNGMTNTDIAEKQFVSINTIKYHVRNIYMKTEVNSREELREKMNVFSRFNEFQK